MIRQLCRFLLVFFVLTPLGSLGVPIVQAAGATTFNVVAGAASSDGAVMTYQFYPAALTVDVGDTVTWTAPLPFTADNTHTVSFNAPAVHPSTLQPGVPQGGTSVDVSTLVSSGNIPPTGSYTLTFPKAGTFNYECLYHKSMLAAVVVQAAGVPYPPGQAAYQAATDSLRTAALQAGATAAATFVQQPVARTPNADGTATYAVQVGSGDGKTYGLMRYSAKDLTVHVGDSVFWTNKDPNVPHTVTFLDRGQDVPSQLPGGQRNPKASMPAGGSSYAGSGFVNSGQLFVDKTYKLTFTQTGTYQYVCVIHDDYGMKANITVVSAALAQIPARMPSTGGGAPTAWSGLVLLGLLLTSGAGLAVRRRA